MATRGQKGQRRLKAPVKKAPTRKAPPTRKSISRTIPKAGGRSVKTGSSATTKAGRQQRRTIPSMKDKGIRGTAGLNVDAGMQVTPEDSPERRAGIFKQPTTKFTIDPAIADQLRSQGVLIPEDNTVQEGSQGFREAQALGAARPDTGRPSQIAAQRPDPAGVRRQDQPGGLLGAQQDVQRRAQEARARIEAQKTDPTIRAEQERVFRERLGTTGFVTDATAEDPFADLRTHQGLGAFKEGIQQSSRDLSEANEKINRVLLEMQQFDKIRAGEFVSEEDQALLESLEGEEAGVEEEIKTQQEQERETFEEKGLADTTEEGIPDATPESTGASAALANLAAGNPQAQAMLPFLEQFQADLATQKEEAKTFRDEQLAETRKTFETTGQQIEDMKSEFRTSTDDITDFIKEAREIADEQLASQHAEANRQLKWTEAQERMKLFQQKAATHDSLVVQLALEGGFGQPAALKGIMETDNAFDEAISDLATNFAFKRTDLAAKFAGLYMENKQNYITNTVNNLKEMRSGIERLTTLGINNTTARQNAINSIMEKGFTEQNALATASSKATLDMAKEITSVIATANKEKSETEARAVSDLQWAATTWGNDTPQAFRDYLSKNLPSGFDVNNALSLPTPKSAQLTEKLAADQLVAKLVGKTIVDGVDVGLLAANSLMGRSHRDRMSEAITVQEMLENGNIEKAKEQIMINLREKFTAKERDVIDVADTQERELILINDRIKDFDDKRGGIYTEWIESGKKIADIRDKGWLALKADIGQMQAAARKEFAGVAVTDTELRALNQWMVDFDSDNIGEMQIKLDNMKEDLDLKRQTRIDNSLGQGSYKFLTGKGVPITTSAPPEDVYTTQSILDILSGDEFSTPFDEGAGGEDSGLSSLFSNGRITQRFDTPVASRADGGIYSQKTVNVWGGKHAGVDLAVPQGTEVPAPFDGTVISAGFEEGWGGTIVFKDNSGGEQRIAHLSEIPSWLKEGTRIRKGQMIARSGGKPGTKGAGNSTGAHIDWRIRRGGNYVNPLTYTI